MWHGPQLVGVGLTVRVGVLLAAAVDVGVAVLVGNPQAGRNVTSSNLMAVLLELKGPLLNWEASK